ncbi:hypothetical protein RHMOL_Rhmol11G0005500 [Rhododendron molle]|uniref:Uncharacterized protein n=1 Tax=Rhododendron molle TaxID=49168 RepID=A0ACC0LND6_RHOML|nr:hypothetical protein RHMOL_Rhmol11G0005500 [Rhododendron molle]
MQDLAKLDGSGDPRTHLYSYHAAMKLLSVEPEAMSQLFPQTLSSLAFHWILSKGESANLPKAKPRTYSGNTNALFGGGNYSNTATSSTNTTSSNTTNHITDVNQVQAAQNNRPRNQPRSFSGFEAPLSSVMEKLVKSGHLKPIDPTPLPKNPPPTFKANLYCAYHQGAGHLTDSCFCLRHAIQDLIDERTLLALPPPSQKPNILSNSMSNHKNGAFVLGASISDLFHQSIPIVQLNFASSLDSPYFNVTDLNPSLNLMDQFQSNVLLPKVDMQAVGWAMANNMDYATPIINEWLGLELDGFP